MISEAFAQAIVGNKSTSVSDDDDANYNKFTLTISAALWQEQRIAVGFAQA
jgi:hypothetical protein